MPEQAVRWATRYGTRGYLNKYEYTENSKLKYLVFEKMTEEQKKRLIGEIFYNEDCLIESLSNDEELRQIMTRSVNELSNNEMQVKLQKVP